MKKDDGGYALVEIIMAIGILAVVSMYFMNMFVLADNTQAHAKDLDAACTLAQTAMETMRAGGPGGTSYFDADWNEADSYDPDGFTLSRSFMESTPPRLVVRVDKNLPYLNVFQQQDTIRSTTLYELDSFFYGQEAAP